MSLPILADLFGSKNRVKILKFFLFNNEHPYSKEDVSSLAKIPSRDIIRELNMLLKIGLIQKKSFFKEFKDGRSGKVKKKRVPGYKTDPSFEYMRALQQLLIKSVPLDEGRIKQQLQKAGKINLIIVSGVFIQEDDATLDLMIVGDKLKDGILKQGIHTIESELGSQLRYAIFSTSDFKYRLSMYDRLIRDVLDYPHQKVLDRIGIDNEIRII